MESKMVVIPALKFNWWAKDLEYGYQKEGHKREKERPLMDSVAGN